MSNVYGFVQVGLRLFPGVHWQIKHAADDLGVSVGEWLRAVFSIEEEWGGRRLVARTPDQSRIAVVGYNNRIVGTLADLMAGRVSLDGPDSTNYLADARLPISARSEDLERREDGSLTGRLSATRRIRKRGREKAVRLARARAALADLAGDAGA